MTEETVRVARDNGTKNRWGIGQFLYRQDGKKKTIQTKWLLWGIGGAFGLSTILVLIKGPTQLEFRSPIAFDGVVSSTSSVEVPVAASESLGEKRNRLRGNQVRIRTYGGLEVVTRSAKVLIPPGTFGEAKLVTGASNGPVKAVLTEDLTVNGEVVVSSGTTLVGTGSSTEDRLLVDFSKMVLKDGTFQSIRAEACDAKDQVVGLKGSFVNKYGSALAAGIALNFAGGMAEGLQETNVTNGVATRKSDLKNAALNGAATASLVQSKEILEKWKSQKTIIEVKKGTDICVLFPGD